MHREQAFLEMIRRQPGSRIHRLPYADWLTDQGDPRGEFIYLQVQAQRLPRDSPRRLDLEARASDLLLVHESAWLGPLLGAIANWEWRGGLLNWVTVTTEVFLANAEHWLPASPVLGVHLRKARPHIRSLARCKQLAHLSGLYLGGNDLTDDDLEVLLRSPHLRRIRSLYLHSNVLRQRGVEVLASTPNLPRLRELSLGNNHLGDEAVAVLADSPHLGRLRHLNLMLASLGEPGLRTLAHSALLSRLRVLMLGSNLLPGGSLATLVRSPGFANLLVLGFVMNQQNDADLAALADSPSASGLRFLSLNGYQTVGDPGLTALANSPHLGKLTSLSVGSGVWGPAGARALGCSRTLTSLRSLQLTQDNEHARGVPEALLGQPRIRRLRRLDLCVTNVGRKGLAALASHPRPLRLRHLDLTLSPRMASTWEALLTRGLLANLTALSLTDPPPGSVRALLQPGGLPELRRLTLHGLPDLEEFQALLDSPLLGRLQEMRLSLSYESEKKHGSEVIRRLCAVWHTPALRRLGLLWSLSVETVRLLVTAPPPPPTLTELELGVFRLKEEGMAVLASSPLLRQLHRLVLVNSSAQAVPGLEALAESPHVGPLLRVDIHNGHVPREAVSAVRRQFGGRIAVSGRSWPRMISLGGWGELLGDGED